MRVLDRKLFRELKAMKGQVAAIAGIVACGVATWVAMLMCWNGLRESKDAYYREYRMADVFAPVKKAPRYVATKLEAVPGVRRVRPRIVFDVAIDLPEVREPCVGRMISVPDHETLPICGLHLTQGRWFSGRGESETIVGDRFATAHGLAPGDRIHVIMNNRKEALTIVGTALSPEYVYMIRGAGELLPDPEHFTALWTSETFAQAVFDFQDSANSFVATIDPDVSVKSVIAEFDRILERYGSLGAYPAEDQVSNRYLQNEIDSLRGTATMIPTVFLGVAAFVLHMLLARLVRAQRTQIAVFRAYGHSTAEIARHYLKLSVLIGFVGSVAGIAIGVYFAQLMLKSYQEFYQFPVLRFDADPGVVLSGVGVASGFCVLGALSAARRAARLQPAEGLRPEAPGVFHPTLIERWRWLWRHLGFGWRMVTRNVLRAKFRSGLTIVGVSLSGAILVLGLFMYDSIGALMEYQYRRVEKQDVRVTFNQEKGTRALFEIGRVPGVLRAEPELTVPVEFVNGPRSRRTALVGLRRGDVLRAFVDRHGRPVPRPDEGLVLSGKLAELLGVRPGDDVTVRVLHGKQQEFPARVERTLDEYIGTSAYADLHRLSRWIDEEEALTSVLLAVDGGRAAELARTLKDVPAVESVVFSEQSIRMFEETLAAFIGIMTGILIMFGGVISFGVIYNSSRITLAERERTLASMHILGFTEREVARIITRENLLLAVVAIPSGLALGAAFCYGMVQLYDTDLFRFPMVLTDETLLVSGVSVFVFAVLANVAVRRRIRKLDMIEALKSRE